MDPTDTRDRLPRRSPGRGPDLAALRSQLDGIDEQLLALLAERLDTCVQIALYKRDHDVPMMQPGRIALVHARAERFGLARGVEPGFLHRLYDEIIAEACRVEDAAMAQRVHS